MNNWLNLSGNGKWVYLGSIIINKFDLNSGLPIYGGMRPVQINSLARGDGHRISENILLKILEELLENLFCKNRETHKPASLKAIF